MKKFLSISLAILFLIGCNPIKKVMKNKADFEQIGKTWAEEHPCANDTIIITKPGRIDSIPFAVPVVDADLMRHKTDSIARSLLQKYNVDQAQCDSAVREAYNVGFQQATLLASSVKIPVQRPDTIQKIVVDVRERDLLKNDKLSLSDQLLKQISITAKMKQQKSTAYMVSVILGLLFLILLIFYIKK